MAVLNVRITDPLYRALKIRAAEQGCSLKDLVQHACQIYIDHDGPECERAPAAPTPPLPSAEPLGPAIARELHDQRHVAPAPTHAAPGELMFPKKKSRAS